MTAASRPPDFKGHAAHCAKRVDTPDALWIDNAKPCTCKSRPPDDTPLTPRQWSDYADASRARAPVAPDDTPRWQPIATAPKDGTEVLLTDGHYKRTGYWAKRVEVWSMDSAVQLKDPTHWLPLPKDTMSEPDDTPTRLQQIEERRRWHSTDCECDPCTWWAEVSRLRKMNDELGREHNYWLEHSAQWQRKAEDAEADVSRLQQSLTEKEDLLKQIMRTVHVGTFQAAPVAVEGLSESVSRLQQENAHYRERMQIMVGLSPDLERSKLLEENALLKRSLEMLTKELDEKDERIRELETLTQL